MEAPFDAPDVGRNSQFATRWLILAVTVMCVACTPTVYKPEVERIGSAIGSATDSFKTLVVDNSTNDIADRNKGFVADKARLALGPDCAKIDAFIKAQNACLASWSLFRQNPSITAKPGCVEPLPFAPIPTEMQQCAIGKMQGGRFVSVPLATASSAQNHLRLAEALAAYAAQLGAIVSSEDREQLEAAVADAVAATRSVQAGLAAANPSAKSLDLGPIADFVGTGLLLVLEARRFSLLKSVAAKADPVIQQASGQLSLFANQLYYINTLQPAFAALDNAVLRAVPDACRHVSRPRGGGHGARAVLCRGAGYHTWRCVQGRGGCPSRPGPGAQRSIASDRRIEGRGRDVEHQGEGTCRCSEGK